MGPHWNFDRRQNESCPVFDPWGFCEPSLTAGVITRAAWRCSPRSGASLRRIWNKISEWAFVFEDHRILGGGYEALAILIGNLLGHRLRLTHRQVGSLFFEM
jgi:hypothetical protein